MAARFALSPDVGMTVHCEADLSFRRNTGSRYAPAVHPGSSGVCLFEQQRPSRSWKVFVLVTLGGCLDWVYVRGCSAPRVVRIVFILAPVPQGRLRAARAADTTLPHSDRALAAQLISSGLLQFEYAYADHRAQGGFFVRKDGHNTAAVDRVLALLLPCRTKSRSPSTM